MGVFDFSLCFFLLVTLAVGVSRGFIREVSSILAWILAGVATFWDIPLLRSYMATHIETTLVANAVAALAAFVIAFTIVSLIGTVCASLVRGTLISPLDRMLGAAVGVLKGVFLLGGLEILASCFIPRSSMPKVITEESFLSPALFAFSDWLRPRLPEAILCHLDRLQQQNVALGPSAPISQSSSTESQHPEAPVSTEKQERIKTQGELKPKEILDDAKAIEGAFTKEQNKQLDEFLKNSSTESAAPVVYVDPGEQKSEEAGVVDNALGEPED